MTSYKGDIITLVLWLGRQQVLRENWELMYRAFGEDISLVKIDDTLDEEAIDWLVNQYGTVAKYIAILPVELLAYLVSKGVEVYRFKVVPEGKYVRPISLCRVVRCEYEEEVIT